VEWVAGLAWISFGPRAESMLITESRYMELLFLLVAVELGEPELEPVLADLLKRVPCSAAAILARRQRSSVKRMLPCTMSRLSGSAILLSCRIGCIMRVCAHAVKRSCVHVGMEAS